MRLYASLLFLTLVVTTSASQAAPVTTTPPPIIDISPKHNSEPIFSTDDKTERDWSVRFGFLGGALDESRQAEQVYFYGLRADFLREPLSTWEFEFITAKDNILRLSLGKKFYFPLEEVTRPYYRFSLGDLIGSTDGLGAILNPKRIQAIAAVGLDDMFKLNQRLQGELSIAYAGIGPQLEMSLGIAF